MRHIVDFRNTSDTGEIDADAIIPYSDGEAANQTTFRRPVENTRSRTEVLRLRMREHILMRDIDRNGPGLWGGGTITFNGTVAGGGDGKFTTASSLFVVPMITPGDGVGTTAPYIASSKARLTIGTLGVNQVIVESVKKQFEGSDLVKADANRISVEVLNDTAETIALEGAPGDVNNIKITIISGTTSAQDLIDLINNDISVTQLVTASLEATSVGTNNADLFGPNEWGSDFTQRYLQGGYPGVVHEIPFGNINSFFSASAENCLQKGDTLAISYDEIIDTTGGTGGVLQSTPENGNTIMGPGSLFNTRREPEKCANAIAICKCIDDDTIIFIDGSYIKKGVPASLYFDSGSVTNAALLGAIDTSGWVRLDIAPGAHTPPTNVQEALNNTDDIFDFVMNEIEAARNSTVYGAQSSLDARLEPADTEIYNARNSATYGAKASLDLRIEEPELEIAAARATDALLPSGSYTDLADRLSRHAGHSAAVVTVSSVAGDDAMFTDIGSAITALNAADGGTILVRKGAAPYSITSQMVVNKPIRLIAVEPGIEIQQNNSTAGQYILYFNTGSDRSLVWGFRFTQGTTGNNRAISLVGSTYRITVERCEIHGAVLSDSAHSHFLDCDFYEPTVAAGETLTWLVAARTDHVMMDNCRFYSAASGGKMADEAYFVSSGFSPKQMRFCNCEFDVRDNLCAMQLINGERHSLENIYVSCEPFRETSTAIMDLRASRMDVDSIHFVAPSSTTDWVRQPVFVFGSAWGRAHSIYINCSNPFVAFLTNNNIVRLIGSHSTVSDLTLLAKIPAATDVAPDPPQTPSGEPLIYIRDDFSDSRITLKDSFVLCYNSGSGTNGYYCTIFGDNTDSHSNGSITVDGLRVDMDALNNGGVANELFLARHLPLGATVRNGVFKINCNDGHGLWIDNGHHLNIVENNKFYMVPDGATYYPSAAVYLAGSAGARGDGTRVVNNQYYGKPTGGSSGTIQIRGGGTAGSRANGTQLSGNQLVYTASNNGCFIQYWLNGGGFWGNVVYNGTSHITQTDCTSMVPTAATAGTYNTLA